MTDESRETQIRRYLAAFADGELDIEQTLEVLDRLKMDPQATQRVVHQQQLRQAVARVMRAQAPPVPGAVRESLNRLADQHDHVAADDPTSPRRSWMARRLTRWSPIAAVLVLGVFIGLQAFGPPEHADASDRILADDLVQKFTNRHVGCTRMTQKMMQTVRFPGDVRALPGALRDYLQVPLTLDTLDLSAVGYRFRVAGQCPVPGGRAVHLVYQADPQGVRRDGLSLWVQVYTGQPELAETRLYRASGADAAHPFLVWRTGNLAYYLVGDSDEHVRAVAAELSGNVQGPDS